MATPLSETDVSPPQLSQTSMQVDNHAGICDELGEVCDYHSSPLSSLIVANDDIPDPSMKPISRLPPHFSCTF